MAWDWGGSLGGAASGASAGAAVGGPWGAAGGGVLGGVLGGMGGKKKKSKQVPMEPPEVTAARGKLYNFANTGRYGNFTAGDDVGLGLGDFDMTGIEGQGLSTLQGLLSSGIPDQFRLGDEALRDILATSPGQVEAQFTPFQAQIERQIRDSNTALKRNAGFAGNLYSTNTIRGLGDIQARGNETLTAELARLTNQAMDRRMQAIPLAYQAGEARQNAALQQVAASQTYGGLTRQLNDAKIKARDAEILRRRQELQLPIQAAQSVIGANVNYGVPEVDVQQESPYQSLLNMAGQLGGQYLGNEMTMRQYQRYFPSGTTA